MKKLAFIFLLAFVTILAVSSCNKEACPAYSNSNSDNTENIG